MCQEKFALSRGIDLCVTLLSNNANTPEIASELINLINAAPLGKIIIQIQTQ